MSDRELATLGGGCFWCLEAVFEQVEGVHSVKSGYAGGHVDSPTYKHVCTGETGHAEVVQVEFDPSLTTYGELLEIFFGIPGLGSTLFTAIQNSDLPVVKAFTMLGAVLYVFFNVLADVLYALVDPRIRLA